MCTDKHDSICVFNIYFTWIYMYIVMNTCKSTHTYNPTHLQEYVYTYVLVHINTHFFPMGSSQGVADFLPELLAPLDTEAVKEGF